MFNTHLCLACRKQTYFGVVSALINRSFSSVNMYIFDKTQEIQNCMTCSVNIIILLLFGLFMLTLCIKLFLHNKDTYVHLMF